MDTGRRGPSQEYLLQGSVLDDSVDILLHRLRQMSDNSEEGLVKFREQETVYSMRESSGNNQFVSVRVRRQLMNPEQPYTLCYLGNPEIGDRNRLTTVRTCVEVNCSQSVCAFLQELGFTADYEFISQGFIFRRNRLKATVSKIYKMLTPPNTEQLSPISKSHLIEVSTISGSGNEQAAIDVHTFAEQLKPLISLDKIDSRRIG